MDIPAKHILQSKFSNSVLREWQCSNTEIGAHNLMYPLFIAEADDAKECVASLPNVHRIGINLLREYLEPTIKNGLKSVLLFGVLNKLPKDDHATHADSAQNPVIKAIPLLKKWYPELTIACDVCLCPYISHGHCGIIGHDKHIDNSSSCIRIAEVACSYARAGADIVAPSDMMDGRIGAIKSKLREANLISRVSVLSYSAKFQSCMYGPFRDVANSAPSFGDRRCYQLPPGSKGLAFLAAKRDVEEGCDMLMVKPGLFYLDIVKQTKDAFPEYPLFAYQVSGEYAMLFHAAANNVFDLKVAVKESLLAYRRAGVDCIITYFTPMILNDLAKAAKGTNIDDELL
ncbi:delta-aminolevulinic acid dehydratase [Planococcus citri]|uniref:delta-aminolevulinic acid dehydratase n=1 Tax=Planococcus citri TaxID=170843 RepID=UPI0031F7E40F